MEAEKSEERNDEKMRMDIESGLFFFGAECREL